MRSIGTRASERAWLEMHHAANALALVHQIERSIDITKRHSVCNKVAQRELAC